MGYNKDEIRRAAKKQTVSEDPEDSSKIALALKTKLFYAMDYIAYP